MAFVGFIFVFLVLINRDRLEKFCFARKLALEADESFSITIIDSTRWDDCRGANCLLRLAHNFIFQIEFPLFVCVNDRDKKRDAIKVDKINDETWESCSLGLGGICCSSCLLEGDNRKGMIISVDAFKEGNL